MVAAVRAFTPRCGKQGDKEVAMASTRTRNIILIAVLIPVVLLLAGIVTLKLVFTGDRLKAMVVPQMEEATGRTVAMGQIGLSVFPSLAVDIDSLQIANRSGEGFSPDPFLSLERLRLNVSLFALLGGRVEVTSLMLDRPRLLLEVNGNNLTNYSDLGAAEHRPAAGTPDANSAAAFSLFISAFRVEHGVLEYLNHRTDSATRLHAVTIEAGLETERGQFILEGEARSDSLSYGSVDAALIDGLEAALVFRMVYDLQSDLLTFERGKVTVQQIPLNLSGTIAGLRAATTLDLSIGSDEVSVAQLFSLIPRTSSEKAVQMTGSGKASVRIDVTGVLSDSTEAETRGRIAARDASLQYAGLPRPITEITVLAGFTRTASVQEVHVDTLTARMGEAPVALSMRITNFDDPRLRLSVSGVLQLGQLHEYYPLEEGTSLSGVLQARVQVVGPVREPKELRASGTMDFRGVSIATAETPSPLRDLTGSIAFNNQILESRRLSLMLGKSDLTLGFRLVNYLTLVLDEPDGPRPSATLTLQSDHLRSEDIMRGEDTPAWSDRQGSSAARSGLPLPDVSMEMTVTIATLSTEKFEFRNVRGALGAADGVLTLKDLRLEAFGGSVYAAGSLNLRERTRPLFDLKLTMRALRARELLTPFTTFGQRLGGSLSMQTSLAGAMNDTLGIVPSTLNGSGSVSIADGSLQGFRVNQVLARTLNLPDLETVTFHDWHNSFTVRDGRVILTNLVIKALNADYVVNGSHGLDGTIDYRMALYLPAETAAKVNIPGFAGEAVKLFQDEAGRLKFDFEVGGTTDAPTLRLDTEPAKKKAEQMANEKLKQEMQKLQDTVKDKAGDILKKLFKPPPH
jgi:uncharacterized protein involved in outer membrane biogenesis